MNKILVTGGAGFIGTNLIKQLLSQNTSLDIHVLDNFFTGKKENKINGVTYHDASTWEIDKVFSDEEDFDTVFHFGEYSRIVKSFDDIKYVTKTNLLGTSMVLEKCKNWNAKLIYSASSSGFGNSGDDQHLNPYSWAKAKMVELIKNYNKWF